MQREGKERKARVRHRIREQKTASRVRKHLEDAVAAAAAVATPGGRRKQMSTRRDTEVCEPSQAPFTPTSLKLPLFLLHPPWLP